MIESNKGTYYPKGTNGEWNKNNASIEKPDPAEFINPSHSVNGYKSYLRENLAKNIRESRVREFMGDLEANERIFSLYDTMGFLNELESLENQYLRLRNKIPLFPFYKSLKDRISKYADATNESDDFKKVLAFLHTSVVGKIFHLRNSEDNFKNHISITDLLEYLEMIQKNIRKLGEIETEVSIADQTEAYQESLKDKIDSALAMVNSEVVPTISRLFEPLAREIVALLEAVVFNSAKAKEEEANLESKLRMATFLSGMKNYGAIASLCGSVGQIVSTFIEITSTVIEGVQKAMQALSKLSSGLEELTKPMKDMLKEPFRLYLKQLEFMDEIPEVEGSSFDQRFLDFDFGAVKNNISNFKTEVNSYLEVNNYVNIKVVVDMRKNLDKIIAGASAKCKHSCSALKKMEMVNKLKNVALGLWDEIKQNGAKLKELFDQHLKMAQEFNKWNARMEQIIYVLLPMLLQIEETMITITAAIGNKTQVELDITAWKVQSSLKEFKLIARQLSDETSMQDNINLIIEKIDDAFGTMVDIYDRIQSFMDQSKYAGFLSGMNSPNKRNIENPELRKIVLQLERVIQSNLVLEQYDVAIHAFKQHFFPFASMYLANFNLPVGLQTNNTEILAGKASEEIDFLQDQVKFLEVSLGRYDREIFGEINFNGNNASIAKPFYIFRSREFKDLFKKLLSGEEIIIKADITKGLSQNAVKFNQIGIQLKLIDEQMQDEFDAQLEYYGVKMSLIGLLYYKCGEKFYYVSVDDNVVIEYSFRKNSNGKPIKYNEVYRKLSENHYFLSPYATWKIQLMVIEKDFASTTSAASSQNGFNKLAKFAKSSLNLELVGRGQYFRSSGTLEAEICTNEVGKYYQFDKSLSDVFITRSLKQKYLLK